MSDKSILVSRLLDVIENDIASLTAKEVIRGNKIFGAAILFKQDFSLVKQRVKHQISN